MTAESNREPDPARMDGGGSSTASGDGTATPATAFETDPVEDPPDWLGLDPREEAVWVGGPRIQRGVYPALIVALVGLGALAAGAVFDQLIVGALLGALALVSAVIPLLRWRATDYVITTEGVYAKRGVLRHATIGLDFDTIQNVAVSQSMTGGIFDHGDVSIQTAGGEGDDLTFRSLNGPQEIGHLIEAGRDAYLKRRDRGSVPGTTAQWEAVLEEVRAIRQRVERSDVTGG